MEGEDDVSGQEKRRDSGLPFSCFGMTEISFEIFFVETQSKQRR